MRYHIGGRLALGGMGDVYLAQQASLGGFEKLVVVKRINPEFADDVEVVQMLCDEARLAARLRHPNIVETLSVERDERGLFIVMGYLPGLSLRTVLDRFPGGVHQPVAIRVATDIAAALAAAHAYREAGTPLPITHRDVTPANIQLCRSGDVKLLDFGVAQQRSLVPPSSTRVRGTLWFMSPEMLADEAVGPSSDVYQLGLVLFHMVEGRPLFDCSTEEELAAAQRTPLVLSQRWSPELAGVVRGCLALDAAQRPANGGEVADQLEALSRRDEAFTHRQMAGWLEQSCPDALLQGERLEQQALFSLRRSTPVETASLPDVAPPRSTVGATKVDRPSRAVAGAGKRGWLRGAVALVTLVALSLAVRFALSPEMAPRVVTAAPARAAVELPHLAVLVAAQPVVGDTAVVEAHQPRAASSAQPKRLVTKPVAKPAPGVTVASTAAPIETEPPAPPASLEAPPSPSLTKTTSDLLNPWK